MTNKYDLAFVFVDLGDPWWRTAVTEMLRSVGRVMPDARIVQLTDSESRAHPWVDEILRADVRCTPDILSKFKSYMIAQHTRASDRPAIFCDADVIWLAKPDILKWGGAAYDDRADALPWRQFYIQSGTEKPEWLTQNCEAFLDALPQSTWANDAAELYLNFNIPKSIGAPQELRPEDTIKYLAHFPGKANRENMIAYARSIDGGQPFKSLDPGYEDRVFESNLGKPMAIPSALTMKRMEQEEFSRQYRAQQGGVNEDLTSITFTQDASINT